MSLCACVCVRVGLFDDRDIYGLQGSHDIKLAHVQHQGRLFTVRRKKEAGYLTTQLTGDSNSPSVLSEDKIRYSFIGPTTFTGYSFCYCSSVCEKKEHKKC